MKLAETIIRRKKTVVVIWAIAFIALTPLIINYSHFISYSISSSSLTNTESGKAQSILSSLSPQNSSLIVVVQTSSEESQAQIANSSIAFQNSPNLKTLPYYANSTSAFSAYASFLDSVLSSNTISAIRTFYGNFSSLSTEIYSFPSAFLGNWSASGYTQSSISQTASRSGFSSSSSYESSFVNALNKTFAFQTSMSGAVRVQSAIQGVASESFGTDRKSVV